MTSVANISMHLSDFSNSSPAAPNFPKMRLIPFDLRTSSHSHTTSGVPTSGRMPYFRPRSAEIFRSLSRCTQCL